MKVFGVSHETCWNLILNTVFGVASGGGACDHDWPSLPRDSQLRPGSGAGWKADMDPSRRNADHGLQRVSLRGLGDPATMAKAGSWLDCILRVPTESLVSGFWFSRSTIYLHILVTAFNRRLLFKEWGPAGVVSISKG